VSETLSQVLGYINELLPNRMNSTTIVMLINNEQRKIWRQMTSTNYYEMVTASSQAIYNLPSDCEFDMIAESGIMLGDSTNAVTSTTIFEPYTFCGADDELAGNNYYEGVSGTFGLYPVPQYANYPIRIKYQERPTLFASSDGSAYFNLDQDYIDLIKFRVMSRVAKSGNNPDVELANNYETDAEQIERKLRLKKANEKLKTSRKKISCMLDFRD
jgi:hypothetical protein